MTMPGSRNQNNKTLYVTDLDGTLLNSFATINPYSIEVINSLVEQGMLFTYATARSLVSASVAAKGLSLKIPVIAYNGAFIFYPETGEIIASEGFEKEERDKVVRVMKEHQLYPLVYSYVKSEEKVSWVTSKENEGMRRYLDLRKGDRRLRPLESEEGLYDGEMFYYTLIGDKEQLQPIHDIFSEDERFTCTLQQELYRTEYWCEIMPKKATKANAILKLKELWNCNKIISFGDAINDIPMFRISDECYAVENAVDELKQLATATIKGNDEDGVAIWLKEHVKNI